MPRSGLRYRLSRISGSVILVFVICTCTPEVPCQFGPAPLPPAMVCQGSYFSCQIDAKTASSTAHLVVTPTTGDFPGLLILASGSERQAIHLACQRADPPVLAGSSAKCRGLTCCNIPDSLHKPGTPSDRRPLSSAKSTRYRRKRPLRVKARGESSRG